MNKRETTTQLWKIQEILEEVLEVLQIPEELWYQTEACINSMKPRST